MKYVGLVVGFILFLNGLLYFWLRVFYFIGQNWKDNNGIDWLVVLAVVAGIFIILVTSSSEESLNQKKDSQEEK